MNVLAIYVANEHIQSLMEQSVERYMAQCMPTGPSLRDRVASAATALRRRIGSPNQSAGILPSLHDYPYRS